MLEFREILKVNLITMSTRDFHKAHVDKQFIVLYLCALCIPLRLLVVKFYGFQIKTDYTLIKVPFLYKKYKIPYSMASRTIALRTA